MPTTRLIVLLNMDSFERELSRYGYDTICDTPSISRYLIRDTPSNIAIFDTMSQFKLASLTYKVLHTGLHHICLNASISTSLLAPCDHHPPLTCTSLALIFILVHTPTLVSYCSSNSLEFSPPSTLRSSQTLNTFRKHLKTHLFQSAFNSP